MNYARTLPFIAVLAVLIFSGLKPEPVPQVFDDQDKLHHLCGFAAFMFTLRLAFPRWHVFWAAVLSLATGLLIEVGQSFLPNRQASLGDMLANSLGVLVGWGCWYLASRWYRRRTAMASTREASAS